MKLKHTTIFKTSFRCSIFLWKVWDREHAFTGPLRGPLSSIHIFNQTRNKEKHL